MIRQQCLYYRVWLFQEQITDCECRSTKDKLIQSILPVRQERTEKREFLKAIT